MDPESEFTETWKMDRGKVPQDLVPPRPQREKRSKSPLSFSTPNARRSPARARQGPTVSPHRNRSAIKFNESPIVCHQPTGASIESVESDNDSEVDTEIELDDFVDSGGDGCSSCGAELLEVFVCGTCGEMGCRDCVNPKRCILCEEKKKTSPLIKSKEGRSNGRGSKENEEGKTKCGLFTLSTEKMEEKKNSRHAVIAEQKRKIKSLQDEMRKLEAQMAVHEDEISKLEWQEQCCRGLGEIELGDFRLHTEGKVMWSNTDYPNLKRVLDALKSVMVNGGTEAVEGKSVGDLEVDRAELKQTFARVHACLMSLSCKAYEIAIISPKFDVCPAIAGNGWRSLLDVLESCITAVLLYAKKQDKKWFRTLRPDSTVVTYLHTWEKVLTLAMRVILDNAPVGGLFPVQNFEGMLNDLMELPLEVFYGKFFGVHYSKSLRRLLGLLLVAMASYGDGMKSGEGMKGRIRAVMTSTKYLAFNKKAALRTVQLFGSGDINFLKAFWGLQETVSFVEIDTAIRTPSPSVNIVFRIPVEPISPPASEVGKRRIIDVHVLFENHHKRHHSDKHYQQQEARNMREKEYAAEHSGLLRSVSATCSVEFDKDLRRGLFQHVQVRLLSYNRYQGQLSSHGYEKLSKPEKRQSSSGFESRSSFISPGSSFDRQRPPDMKGPESKSSPSFYTPATSREEPKKKDWIVEPMATGLLIHIHGGGFVAQTSKAHLNYLRDYAKGLNVPILSFDYSLSPEAPFPQPLYEAFYAYCWAIAHPQVLGTTAERVVLTGDSAGANLVIAVTMLAIEMGVRVPDVIVPVYPALLAKRIPSPARIISIIDPLLATGVLLQCLYCYSSGLEVFDEYMSPVFCRDELFQKFPPVQLITGKLDPLLDDTILFASHLKRNNCPLILQLLEGLPHGFLGFNRVCGEATNGTKIVLQHLKYAFRLRQKPPYPWLDEAEQNIEAMKISIDSFDSGLFERELNKNGMKVVLSVYQPPAPFVESEFDMTNVNFSEMKLLGYVKVLGKKYFVVPPPLTDEKSFRFRACQKKVQKKNGEMTIWGFKNLKSGKFLARSHLSDSLSNSNWFWDQESIDTRTPRWRLFKNGLSDSESLPFRFAKDHKSLCLGEGEPLFFKMVDSG